MSSTLPRQLTPEILDDLPPGDPRAVHSRADLRRINRIMGNARLIGNVLAQSGTVPERIVELGAGDGSLLLQIARRFATTWPGVHVTLLDRQNLVSSAVRYEFEQLGWHLDTLTTNVEDWIACSGDDANADVILANLFVHHFDTEDIARLFLAISERAEIFVACEPRRTRMALVASGLVGLLGANDVTRTDAVLSVRAGFHGKELSALWPSGSGKWSLKEVNAGLFSHLFNATRLPR